MNIILIAFTIANLPVFIVKYFIEQMFGNTYGVKLLDEIFGKKVVVYQKHTEVKKNKNEEVLNIVNNIDDED